jgi:hypothetical protein
VNRQEANFDERRFPPTPFRYPGEVAFAAGVTIGIEIFRQAVEFVAGILEDSRTERAAFVRLAAAKYILFRKEPASKIARRLGVSKRHFHRTVAELKSDCGIC